MKKNLSNSNVKCGTGSPGYFRESRKQTPREEQNDDGGLCITRERNEEKEKERNCAKFAGKCSLISTTLGEESYGIGDGRERERERREKALK